LSQLSNKDHPFPGLKSYGSHESNYFSGRNRQKHELLKKLSESNFAAVVGSNGIGKTSFVNSEILPELHKGFIVKGLKNWKIVAFRPGKNPLDALATALSSVEIVQSGDAEKIESNLNDKFEHILRSNKFGVIEIIENYKLAQNANILLFIDHLDDLIFYADYESRESSKKDIEIFIDRLVETINQSAYPISVITTLRTEIAGHFSRFPHLAEVINKNQFLLSALDRKELLPIFDKITAAGAITFSPDLIAHINNFYKTHPLALGEFQHAMKRCVETWRDEGGKGPVSLANLVTAGGLDHSISHQLDNTYGFLSKEDKQTCRLIFQAITGMTTAGTALTIPRSIQEISEITNRGSDEIIGVAKHFTDVNCGVIKVYDAQDITGRLEQLDHILDQSSNKISANSEISVAQDILLEAWPRLDKWVKEERLNANIYADIAKDVAKKEPPYEGGKLKETWKWYEQSQPHLGWAKRYHFAFEAVEVFLLKSKKRSDRDIGFREAEEKSRQQKSKRNAKIKLAFSILAIVLAIFAIVEKTDAVIKSRQAEEAEQLAINSRKEAEDAKEKAEIEKVRAQMAIVQAQDERKIADKAAVEATEATAAAEKAKIKAAKEQRKAEEFSRKSEALSSEVVKKVEQLARAEVKVKQSQVVEEFLNILERIRGKSEEAEKILRRTTEKDQQLEAAVLAKDGYNLYQETKNAKYKDIEDSILVIQESTQKKLFSSMKMAFQKVNSSPELFQITNGIIVDKNITVGNQNGAGEFLIGTNDRNATVYNVEIKDGNVTAVNPLSSISNTEQKIKGIKNLSYSNDANVFLASHLPIDQVNRFVSLYDANGKITDTQEMEHVVEVIYPFNEDDFVLVDQQSNMYLLTTDGAKIAKPIKILTTEDHLRATDYDQAGSRIYLAKSNRKVVILSVNEDISLVETKTMELGDFNAEITALKFIPNRNWLAVGNRNGEFYLYDVISGNLLYRALNEHAGNINCLELSNDQKTLVSGGRDKIVNIWDLHALEVQIKSGDSYQPIEFDEAESIRDISFVDDDWILIVSSTEGLSDGKGGVSLLTLDFDVTGRELRKLVK
jgi:WD40 repeat protein